MSSLFDVIMNTVYTESITKGMAEKKHSIRSEQNCAIVSAGKKMKIEKTSREIFIPLICRQ